MKRLFSSLREKHQDAQERKRIDTEILGSLKEHYGFDIEIKDFQRQFDEFLSSYDTDMLSYHLKIYLSKLNRSGKKAAGIGKSDRLLSLASDKNFKAFMQESGFKYSSEGETIRERYSLDSPALQTALIKRIGSHASNIVSKVTVLLSFVPNGHIIAEKLTKELDTFFRNKHFLEQVLLGQKNAGPIGFIEILISSYQKIQKSGLFPQVLEEIKNDIEVFYFFHFFKQSLYPDRKGKKKKEERSEEIYKGNDEIIYLFKELLVRFQSEEDIGDFLKDKDIFQKETAKVLFFPIPHEVLNFLLDSREKEQISFKQLHSIIALFSSNKYLYSHIKSGRNLVLFHKILELFQENKIGEERWQNIKRYFEKKNLENNYSYKSGIEFDIKVLTLGIEDVLFLTKLNQTQQHFFHQVFIQDDGEVLALLYSKEIINSLGVEGFERMEEIDINVIRVTLEKSSNVSGILSYGTSLEIYKQVSSLFPHEHSVFRTISLIYNELEAQGFTDFSRLNALIEKNQLALVLHYLKQDQTSTYISQILLLSDCDVGNIKTEVIDFLGKFLTLEKGSQQLIILSLKENGISMLEELFQYQSSKDLRDFLHFTQKSFPGEPLSVSNIGTIMELMSSTQVSTKGEEIEGELGTREILIEFYGEIFASRIFEEIDERFYGEIIEIGNYSSPQMQQMFIHYLLENPKACNSGFIQIVLEIMVLLEKVGCYSLIQPEKFFHYCSEINPDELESLTNYIYQFSPSELRSNSNIYMNYIMYFMKHKKNPPQDNTAITSDTPISNKNINTKAASIRWKEAERKILSFSSMTKRKNKTGHNIYIGEIHGIFQMIVLPVGKGDVKYYFILQTIEKLSITLEEWNSL